MAPLRGTRYHLKEQRQANQRPENAKELFNLRHSSLRNVIERIFGVLKRQWQILGGNGCEYSIESQIDLFCALIGLYNFGKQCGEINEFLDEAIDTQNEQVDQQIEVSITPGTRQMDKRRDNIADKM